MPSLTRRFDEAFTYAHEVHGTQTRKGTGVPYIGHLMGVASIVIDDGGSEDEAIAALLHDAPEDRGGRERLEDIRTRFGDAVATIVEDCTDSWTTPKAPWPERKQQYAEHARTLGPSSLRVSAADKVHNAYAILRDATPAEDDRHHLVPNEDIARLKLQDLNCDTVEAAMRMVEGSARSMGIEVGG